MLPVVRLRQPLRSILVGLVALLVLGLSPLTGVTNDADAFGQTDSASLTTEVVQSVELPDHDRIVALSPDGASLATLIFDPDQLCVVPLADLTQSVCADLETASIRIWQFNIVWSPDSTRIAFAEDAPDILVDSDIWVMDVVTGALTNVTDDGASGRLRPRDDQPDLTYLIDLAPAWSHDGQKIAFGRTIWTNGEWDNTTLAVVDLTNNTVQTLADATSSSSMAILRPPVWTADDARIIYSVTPFQPDPAEAATGVWAVDANGGMPTRLLELDPEVGPPTAIGISSDGQHLVVFYELATGATQYSGIAWRHALVDLTTGTRLALDIGEPGVDTDRSVGGIAVAPDSASTLVVASTFSGVEVWGWDVTTQSPLTIAPLALNDVPLSSPILPLTWSTNDSIFLPAGSMSGTVIRVAPDA